MLIVLDLVLLSFLFTKKQKKNPHDWEKEHGGAGRGLRKLEQEAQVIMLNLLMKEWKRNIFLFLLNTISISCNNKFTVRDTSRKTALYRMHSNECFSKGHSTIF